ncbi:RsmE family RNA methyltransferase [Candidatus Bandiella euplotis]|uniref:Ribosomal RNA small subunit methyltransferase E n=1 Tax=Candidatus Bandiella euplotis TaxID=1664265 RepID=A0ABZ0UN68_9RICK|nr:RsmE family RNA methyltransferase [Candidatus Bandiella woodruffii]WPX96528.1 Ribosomal RNA small subunit methyltransferase E [Candidatus Bandiella woodruffii]
MSALRLFLAPSIVKDQQIRLERENIHYLLNVMKVKNQEDVYIFNDKDGEWLSKVDIISKNNVFLIPTINIRMPSNLSKIILAFSLLKRQNNSLVVQKATELNVREIYPIVTKRSIVRDINIEKFYLVAKEAAEQCNRLDIPKIHNILSIGELITKAENANLILCDNKQTSEAVLKLEKKLNYQNDSAILIGPEGGFSSQEVEQLNCLANCYNVSLGELTLRAETAAISAMFAVQAMYDLHK